MNNSTLMGLPEAPLEDITLRNITFYFEPDIDLSQHEMLSELEDKSSQGNYKLANAGWPGFWGKYKRYPAYGFEFRYIDGLILDNIHMHYPYHDGRDALKFQKVNDLLIKDLYENYKPFSISSR